MDGSIDKKPMQTATVAIVICIISVYVLIAGVFPFVQKQLELRKKKSEVLAMIEKEIEVNSIDKQLLQEISSLELIEARKREKRVTTAIPSLDEELFKFSKSGDINREGTISHMAAAPSPILESNNPKSTTLRQRKLSRVNNSSGRNVHSSSRNF